MIMSNGKIVANGTTSELRRKSDAEYCLKVGLSLIHIFTFLTIHSLFLVILLIIRLGNGFSHLRIRLDILHFVVIHDTQITRCV